MGRFYPLYLRRSDGKAETLTKGQRKKEVNTPTDEQLDQRPDRNGISDFYRQVAPDEPKHLDWRRKIGGMLARELGSGHHHGGGGGGGDAGYILATFPENYRLYEHVKKTVVDGKTEVKSKTHHGAGGNDRQDAYLYGHPLGRRKRFRSPGDFFAHVLWLATDESGDPDNCTCKICSPEDLEHMIPGGNALTKKLPTAIPTPTPSIALPTPTPSTSTPAAPPRTSKPTPQPLPQKNSPDQFYDSHYRSFLYRPGELIWFQRGQAWGLGVIVRRWGQPQNTNDRHYLVQPLSHPPLPSHPIYPSPIIKSSELEMRPWIAWSVPRFTNDSLNNVSPSPQYETIDWQAVKDGRFGTGDLEVDGSILAAKMIDSSYTPFSQTRIEHLTQESTETHYQGIFLGAEKVWIGEPIRLRLGCGVDIMVLHSIIERTSTSTLSEIPQIQFQGDIYTLSQTPHSNPQLPTLASPNSNPHLPSRLTEDLAYRNARSIPRKHFASYWKLTTPQTRVGINDVKGRWYEASLILPILQPVAFAEAERKGEIQEASLWMNSRGDCVVSGTNGQVQRGGKGRVDVRTERREEAFGDAVPSGLVVLEGLVLPSEEVEEAKEDVGKEREDGEMVIDPRFETAEDGGDGGDDQGKGSFDELMNFDGGESGSGVGGFEHEFGGQNNTGQGNFYG